MNITAYRVQDTAMSLVPAERSREWMDALPDRYANRCLPLRIANESGWWLLNSHSFSVMWSGGEHQDCLRLMYADDEKPRPAGSHFGAGILTFSMPYLFRTSPGYNLHIRGPANMPKHGATPLEGVAETDWAPYTATMNWQITAAREPIYFEKGEPICQLVPVKRGELESFEAEVAPIEDNAELHAQYAAWSIGRSAFLQSLNAGDVETKKQGWQKDYFQGNGAPEHQTKLALREFGEVTRAGSKA